MRKVRKVMTSLVVALILTMATTDIAQAKLRAWLGNWTSGHCYDDDSRNCAGIGGDDWTIEVAW